jgi:hypothetical protein
MKRFFLTSLFLLLFLTACDDGVYSGTLIFAGDHQYGSGAVLPGDVYIRAGHTQLGAGARVGGSVYMLGGDLQSNGRIDGDLAVLGGEVTLGPDAVIGGDLRAGNGTVQGVETAVILGNVISGGIPLPQTADDGYGLDDFLRAFSAALLLAGLAAWLNRRAPIPLDNLSRATTGYPLVAGALGLLGLLVLPSLLVMMAFTIILIPVVVVLSLVVFLLLGYGMAALGARLGRRLGRLLRRDWSPATAAFWGTLLLGMVFEIPLLGDGVLVITAVLVMGALLLTRFGLHPYRPPAYLTRPVDEADYGRVTTR